MKAFHFVSRSFSSFNRARRQPKVSLRSGRRIAVAAWLLLPGSFSLAAAPAEAAASAKLDAAAILRELKDFSVAGMDRRLGPDYKFYHPAGTEEKFPEIYLVPPKSVPADVVGGAGKNRNYQLGGPYTKDSGDFSSTQGQVLYVPDHKLAIDPKTKMPNDGLGVDRVTMIEMSNYCFTEKPEAPWWGGFRPDPTSQIWVQRAGDKIGSPVGVARGQGSWSNSGLVLFSSGWLVPAGTVTGNGTNPSFTFPANKLPTAISITSKNEFALVTVIDTEKMQGQVAVLALTSGGKKANMPHEWSDEYPGLPNVAVFTQIKLLGYVDLPGINFPTGLSAASTGYGGRLNGRSGNAGMLSEFDLSNQADRNIFNTGDNSQYTGTAGFAVVISKYEGKVAFLDLQPLFERVRKAYFTTEENFKETRNLGEGPKQWPYTFEGDPSWKPPVLKVLDIAQPTAVISYGRAFIASLDGTITAFDLGGLGSNAPADPAAIVSVGTMKVGRNPTAFAYPKITDDYFLVISRGDREVTWVNWGGDKPVVTRKLRDARLGDPVFAEVCDTHGVVAPIVTIVDFKGRQILNYRYGVLEFQTQGGAKFGVGRDGKEQFECGGALDFPGHPFALSATNVN